jgi:hypothetical protein
LLIAAVLAVGMVLVRAVGTSAWDLGDGALHYLQARYAHQHIHLFFDRWAKPVYVLLGTPFAQLGPLGMVVFNALIAWLTAWCILSLVRPLPRVFNWVLPILLFTSTQYFRVSVSGLTEPLFGLLAVGAVLLLMKERHVAAMLLLSLAPWTRPEYVVLVPFAMAWSIYRGQWKALPWALAGTAAYFVVGGLLLKERIWFFARDPYEGGADFGTGPWWHFMAKAPEALGTVLLVLACLALPIMVLLLLRDTAQRQVHLRMVVLAVLPTLGIWAIHSYAYWAGGFASSGLVRVLATATPLTVLFTAHAFKRLADLYPTARIRKAGIAVLAGLGIWAPLELWLALDLPATASMEQRVVELTADNARDRLAEGNKIYTAHPFFAVAARLDIWDTTRTARNWELELARLNEGDLVEWDSHYGLPDAQEQLTLLRAQEDLAVVSMHMESQAARQTPFAIWLFQRATSPQRSVLDTVVDLRNGLGKELAIWKDPGTVDSMAFLPLTTNDHEYPLDLFGLTSCMAGEVYTEWTIEAHIEPTDGSREHRFIWVFGTPEGSFYRTAQEAHVGGGVAAVRFLQGGRLLGEGMRVFLWNIDGSAFSLHDLKVTRRCILPHAPPGQNRYRSRIPDLHETLHHHSRLQRGTHHPPDPGQGANRGTGEWHTEGGGDRERRFQGWHRAGGGALHGGPSGHGHQVLSAAP